MQRQPFGILCVGFRCFTLIGVAIAAEPQRGGTLRIGYVYMRGLKVSSETTWLTK